MSGQGKLDISNPHKRGTKKDEEEEKNVDQNKSSCKIVALFLVSFLLLFKTFEYSVCHTS